MTMPVLQPKYTNFKRLKESLADLETPDALATSHPMLTAGLLAPNPTVDSSTCGSVCPMPKAMDATKKAPLSPLY